MINPEDFLKSAYRLIDANNLPTEVDYRSAISRAYYSLFHEASNLLEKNGKYKKVTYGAHTKIKDILLKIDPYIGLEFGGFRVDRNEADYDLNSNRFNQHYSKTKVNEISNLISKLKTLKMP